MNIIVTGGAGFLGSHLVQSLIDKNYFPIIVDNLTTGNYTYIKKFIDSGKAKFIKSDIRNLKKLPSATVVIHLGAIASISESIKNPTYVNDVNVNGTLNMLEFCRVQKIKKFIFISSAAVFGENEKKLSESSITTPSTVYGVTKLVGENYCRIYSNLFGIKCIVFRPFNIFGKRQNAEYAAVIPKFLSRLKDNKSPIIYGNGTQTRDFIHVSDVVQAIILALKYNKSNFEIFNLGTGKSLSINHLFKIFQSLSSHQIRAIYKKGPSGVPKSSTSIYKIKKLLKFTPKKAITDGIFELLSEN
ncbi:MAG: NAD-dependent epimerase/dehydratase family protein [Nitrosarchaeum sp.]|nr:NAD-dependent epimerase/dehydratase family protein [Nitrosarchaeum sp.]